MKRLPIIILTGMLVLGGYIFFLSKPSSGSTAYLYFWSEICPHCKNVEVFMETWPGKNKISIEKKEISKSQNNQNLFVQKSAECKIPSSQMGVPLLISPDGKCLSGDQPIIDFLKNM